MDGNYIARSETEEPSLEARFNKTLVESIGETITQILGPQVAEAFAGHLHAHLGLSREDIPSHLKEVFSALDGSFGVGGAVLGRAIIRRICIALGLGFDQKPSSSWVESIEETKRLFLAGAGKA